MNQQNIFFKDKYSIWPKILLAGWIVVLTGCAGLPVDPPKKSDNTRKINRPSFVNLEKRTIPSSPADNTFDMPSVEYSDSDSDRMQSAPNNAAVSNQGAVLLLAKAEKFLSEGDFDKAGANAERAVRLDAKSPRGYILIAQIRLKQHEWSEAEQWAKKGLRYSDRDRNPNLQKYTAWSIIAESRRRTGDEMGAKEAQERLNALESRGFGVY